MFASPAYAQTAAAASGGAAAFVQFVPLVAIFIIFYFLMIRPQQRRVKDHRTMIDAVKKGDEVVTGGGLIGRVIKVNDGEVEVEIAPTVKVKVLKATLSDIRTRGVPAPANDTKN
jgi:preprotein translocase subunit YajC